MKSILQEKKECCICKRTDNLHLHHIFAGSRRKLSDKYGFTVYLCAAHHNLSDEGVHFNTALDKALKQFAQKRFEKIYGREKFMEVFGKNYLEE